MTEDNQLVAVELAHVEDFHCWRLPGAPLAWGNPIRLRGSWRNDCD